MDKKEPPKGRDLISQAQVISNPFQDPASHNADMSVESSVQADTKSPVPETVDSAASPSTASDNDLIEKTWIVAVDRMAKEFGDDPFVLQQKQAELTRNYLQKRFGREIKAS